MPRRSTTVRFVHIAFFVFFLLFVPRAVSQQNSDRFDLRGKVINALSGEPISGALVQLDYQHVQFTQSDGSFVFANLARGQFSVNATKPGFFNDQNLGRNNLGISPEKALEGEFIVKLTPEGIIFGQLRNENDEPVEGADVWLQRHKVENGRREFQTLAQTTTDDQGNFRLAELLPGKYYLSFAPADRGTRTVIELRGKKTQDEGYGSQFYPGTPDLAAATALQVRPGAPLHLSQTFARQHLFQISGMVHGANPGNQIQITLVNSSGGSVASTVRIDPKTGAFQIPGISAGRYMLVAFAFSFAPRSGSATAESIPLNAMLPIHLNSDLNGLVVSLTAGIQAAVHLRDEIQPDAGSNNFHQVTLNMIPNEFSQNRQSVVVPPAPGVPSAPASFENLGPGAYSVQALPIGNGYVAELRSGSVDLLRDDLTIAPGSSPNPIEVTLRGDAAKLTAALQVPSNLATFVVYSQEYPRRSLLMPIAYGEASAFAANLPPGTYQVFALNDASELEFSNPAAVEPYLKHAATITLHPGDNTTIRVELQQSIEPQP